MDSFQFRQNSAIYTDLAVIPTIQWSFKPFVSHLLADDPGLWIPSAVAILPDFDGFLPILSKLNYLDRCNRHPATKMPKLTLCLPPARWGSRALDSQCSGNIASIDGFLSISSKKLDYLYRCYRHPTPKLPKLTLCLPPARRRPKAQDSEFNGTIASFGRISTNLIKTRLFTDLIVIWHLQRQNQPLVSHLLADDSGPSNPSVVAILPNFDDFLIISPKLDQLYRFSRHPTRQVVVLTLCLPPARWGHKTLDFQCNVNIAWFRWILSNFVKTRPFIQIQPSSDPSNGSFNPLSLTCLLRTQGSRFPVQWQYCQISMDFFQFYQNSTTSTDVTVIRPLKCQN